MLKKMMLLASALAALAVPATASADTWADNGVALGAGVHVTQSYEGFLEFNTGPTGKFGCPVTITITTSGPHAATVTRFEPTTTECVGTVAFANCHLIEYFPNTPWNISNVTTPLVATKPGGNITIHNKYTSCAGKQTTSHLEFASINIAVENTNPINKLTISGTSTTGVIWSGSFTPEVTLGLVN